MLGLSAAGVAVARAGIRKELETASGALSQRLAQIQSAAAKSLQEEVKAPNLILPLDQAEELFLPGATETESFIAALAKTLRYGPETIVIATIRTDSYAPLQSSTALRDRQVTFSLPPIGRSDYHATIEGPAARLEEVGRELVVVPTLIDRLVSEAEGGDALPLLTFTLERLYRDYGGDGRIDEADYEALDGMRGAVEAAVETAFTNPDQTPGIPADPGERMELLQGALPWLVGINEANEAALRRVAPWDKIPADGQRLIERLINQRLLRSDVGENDRRVVEIAHEALLRQWPSIQTWLDREADHLRVVQAVERAAADWQSNKQASAWLAHRAERLITAESLVAHRPDLAARWGAKGQAYLSACRSAENAEMEAEKARHQLLFDEQRRRADAEREAAKPKARQLRWAASLAALALLLAGVAGFFWLEANKQTKLAEEQRDRVVATLRWNPFDLNPDLSGAELEGLFNLARDDMPVKHAFAKHLKVDPALAQDSPNSPKQSRGRSRVLKPISGSG